MAGAVDIPPCPSTLKGVQHFLNIAAEHDNRDLTVSYWCRLNALQKALTIDKSSPEAKTFLFKLMDWLEIEKKSHKDNETISNELAAQAYIENYALKLFQWADGMDRAGTFNKNVVKAFYTANILMEVLQTFGELSEDIQQNKKYAKWKAAYIHNCLKNGETPIPGPPESEEGISSTPSGQNTSGETLPSPPRQTSAEDDVPTPATSGDFSPPAPTKPDIQPCSSGPVTPASAGNLSPATPSVVQPTPAVVQPTQEVTYIEADLINKCQKYIKFASSALNYDDYNEARQNLTKALNILNLGRET